MRRFHSLRVCPTIHPMVPVANNSWMKVVSVVTGMAACACFYCALMTLLMIPVYPGDAYLNKFRLLYGAVPALLSVALPAIAGWLWSRSGGASQHRNVCSAGLSCDVCGSCTFLSMPHCGRPFEGVDALGVGNSRIVVNGRFHSEL